MKNARAPWAMATALIGVLGCAPAATQQPRDVLRAYADALEEREYTRAYGLMDEAFRKSHSAEEFAKMVRGSPGMAQRLAKELRSAKKVGVEARFRYGKGSELRLRAAEGGWRIAVDPIAFYGQGTPREALRSFVRAMRHRRYDIVLRFVPSRWAAAMTVEKLKKLWEGEKRGEVDVLLNELEANLGAPIKVQGERASMAYGDKKQARFLREDGTWKIEDPD